MHKTTVFIIWLITLILVGIMGLNQYFAKKNLEYEKVLMLREKNKLSEELIALKMDTERKSGVAMQFIAERDIEQLKQSGLANPIQDLIQDLTANPQLIPEEGVLGGTMGFYDKKHIFVLSNQWVLAYFEDGHNAGIALLEYSVEAGQVNWKVLNHQLIN